MYARVPTFKLNADSLDASVRHFQESSLPELRKLPGFKGATVLMGREKGLLQVVALWDSKQSLDGSFEATKAVRGAYAEKFGAELVSLEEFEVALQV